MLSKAGSLPKLLHAIYPEFAWDEEAFIGGESRPPGYWKDVQNQKACLEKLAAELGLVQVILAKVNKPMIEMPFSCRIGMI